MTTQLEKKTMLLLSLYIHNLIQGHDVPGMAEYLEETPQKDRETLPSLLNCARIIRAAIMNIETPPDTFFDEMWERIEATCLTEEDKGDIDQTRV